jgi:hypothetical protein
MVVEDRKRTVSTVPQMNDDGKWRKVFRLNREASAPIACLSVQTIQPPPNANKDTEFPIIVWLKKK